MIDKVYVVTQGEYSDYHIAAVFTNKDDAVHFCAAYNDKEVKEWYDDPLEIEEYEVGKVIANQLQPVRHVEAHFYSDGDIHFDYINKSYISYEKCRDTVIADFKKDNTPIYTLYFTTSVDKSYKQIEKIAKDKMAQWQAEREGL